MHLWFIIAHWLPYEVLANHHSISGVELVIGYILQGEVEVQVTESRLSGSTTRGKVTYQDTKEKEDVWHA